MITNFHLYTRNNSPFAKIAFHILWFASIHMEGICKTREIENTIDAFKKR